MNYLLQFHNINYFVGIEYKQSGISLYIFYNDPEQLSQEILNTKKSLMHFIKKIYILATEIHFPIIIFKKKNENFRIIVWVEELLHYDSELKQIKRNQRSRLKENRSNL